eukprot:jgi/Bigna1/64887/fgenesh1_kg.88_\
MNLTNGFRKVKGLPPLRWNQGLCEIARRHSRDMAERGVPFGHQGFSNRVRLFPFLSSASAENVAMSEGEVDPADAAVSGWVKSDGHRKNLLSKDFNSAAIGAYQVPGTNRWYITQLFGHYTGMSGP